ESGSACITVVEGTVRPSCDLAISKTIDPDPVQSGQPVTINITVTNVGTGVCPESRVGTVVQDTAPTGMTFSGTVEVNQSGWACPLTASSVTCTSVNARGPGDSTGFRFTGTVRAAA